MQNQTDPLHQLARRSTISSLAISKTLTSTSNDRRKSPTGRRYPRALRHEVIVRASQGERPRDLAAEFNITVTTIYKWCQQAKRDGIEIPDLRLVDKEERDAPKMVRLSTELAVALEDERKARGYPSVAKFLNDLLMVMIDEPNLFDAILDGD